MAQGYLDGLSLGFPDRGASKGTEYCEQVAAVARDLFSSQPAAQLAACQSLRALCGLDADEPTGEGVFLDNRDTDVLEDVRKQCLPRSQLAERLLELAAAVALPPSAGAAAPRQQQHQQQEEAAVIAWSLLPICVRDTKAPLALQVRASAWLRPALKAALQDVRGSQSTSAPQAWAMLDRLVSMDGWAPGAPPAWLDEFLPVAVEALELCPPTDERIIPCALRLFYKLELFWSFGPLLPRAVAAVVDRALVRQQRVTSRMAGLVLGMAATSKHVTPAVLTRIKEADLKPLVHDASLASCCDDDDTTFILTAINLADHSDFQEHLVQWLVPRLVALVHRSEQADTLRGLKLLPGLVKRRPELGQHLAAKGLVPAVARLMAACTEPKHCSAAL